MSNIGDLERRTQKRVVRLLVDDLGYDYLGDLSDRDNRNIDEPELERFLFGYQGYDKRKDGQDLIERAIAELVKVAGNTSLSLYDRNKAVYGLLRYGVTVKLGAGELSETVWLIDWKRPERNRFAVAQIPTSCVTRFVIENYNLRAWVPVVVAICDPKLAGRRRPVRFVATFSYRPAVARVIAAEMQAWADEHHIRSELRAEDMVWKSSPPQHFR